MDRFSLENDGRVIGIAVQDFIVMYLDKLKDGSIVLLHSIYQTSYDGVALFVEYLALVDKVLNK